ncbi:hypothetical protein F4777DRAFT_539425 [Nemania sp. FL0916]|nr:hypothetical protein F4777DRAFT_539425 [Nemania sp. FL0916]
MPAGQLNSQSPTLSEPPTAGISEPRPVQWKRRLGQTACFFVIVVLFTFIAWIILLWLPQKRYDRTLTHTFGIGIDLSPSYATAAVSYPNGSIRTIARVEGDEAYREMMFRLSLSSSEHIHDPHRDLGEAFADIPRQLVRDTRKSLGLPKSRDAGTLSNMIRALRDRASDFVGEPVSSAAISIPHLAALYGEDLRDAFEYLELAYLEGSRTWDRRPAYTSVAAYTGNGLGLCRNYTDPTACREENLPTHYALTVTYTHTSLTTSQANVGPGTYLEEIPAYANLRLGYDHRHEKSYWTAVEEMLRAPMLRSPSSRWNVTMVIVAGDAAEKVKFREVLERVIDDVVGGEQQVVDHDPEFSAAKGIAEHAKRAIFEELHKPDMTSEL